VRVIAALGVAAVIWGWGVAQYPVLLPGTTITLSNAGAPHSTLVAVIVVFIAAVVLIGPSFALLFSLQGRRLLHSPEAGPGGDAPQAAPTGSGRPSLAARIAVLGLVAARLNRARHQRGG
jgi:cytochrome bd ubiquinol oxidase subunit II